MQLMVVLGFRPGSGPNLGPPGTRPAATDPAGLAEELLRQLISGLAHSDIAR